MLCDSFSSLAPSLSLPAPRSIPTVQSRLCHALFPFLPAELVQSVTDGLAAPSLVVYRRVPEGFSELFLPFAVSGSVIDAG